MSKRRNRDDTHPRFLRRLRRRGPQPMMVLGHPSANRSLDVPTPCAWMGQRCEREPQLAPRCFGAYCEAGCPFRVSADVVCQLPFCSFRSFRYLPDDKCTCGETRDDCTLLKSKQPAGVVCHCDSSITWGQGCVGPSYGLASQREEDPRVPSHSCEAPSDPGTFISLGGPTADPPAMVAERFRARDTWRRGTDHGLYLRLVAVSSSLTAIRRHL